jgi:ubiquinone biosynthesis protein COQ9
MPALPRRPIFLLPWARLGLSRQAVRSTPLSLSRALCAKPAATADAHAPPPPPPPRPPPPADESPKTEEERSDPAEESEAVLRDRLLAAALKEVPKHGWTVGALSAGAVACGMSPTAHGVLPRGPIELVRYFNAQCDEALSMELAARREELDQLEVHNRLIVAMETRLNLLHPYVATWPQALALRALPSNLADSFMDARTLSDLLLSSCGPEADVKIAPALLDPHLKRAAVAAVYGAAELYLLTDHSPGFTDTSTFLERKVSALQHAANASAALHGFSPSALFSMLGLRNK